MAFLSLLKRLGQQPRQPWDEQVTNEDLLGAAQQQAPTPYSQNINPTVRPAQVPIATPPLTRPRSVMAGVKQAVTPAPATLDDTLMGGNPVQSEQPQQQAQQIQQQSQQQSQFNIPENPYRQRLADDEAKLTALEAKPVGFWKRFGTGLLQRAITRRGEAPIPITKRQRDIADAQGRLARDLKIGPDIGAMDAREAAIYARQQQLQQGEEKINQAGQRNEDAQLLRYYNGRTDFDPEDPAEQAFVARWQQRFGYKPNRNVRGSQLATVSGYDGEGKPIVSIINKGTGTATQATGQLPTTTDRQLGREQQATTAATNEAGRNRRAGATLEEKKREYNTPRVKPAGPPKPDQTAIRRSAKLAGDIEAVRKELEQTDATQLGPDQQGKRAPEVEAMRKTITDKAAPLISEINNLGAGYEAGIGPQGYPYVKKVDMPSSDLNQSIQGVPTAQGPYVGQQFRRAKVIERGKTLGMTPAQALKAITDGGGQIIK